MKKRVFVALVLAVIITGGAFAQEWYNSYAPGIDGSTLLINAGVGFGSYSGYNISLPPISASVEYAKLPIPVPISVGAYFGIAGYKYDFLDYKYTLMGFGARGAYHFNFLQDLDVYAGVTLGWEIIRLKYDGGAGVISSNTGEFLWGPFVGARYFFTNNIGVYLEAGYSAISFVSAGLSLKF